MSDENEVVAAPESTEPTAAQLLDQIKAKQRELKDQEPAKEPESIEPEQTPEPGTSAPAPVPSYSDKSTEPAKESQAGAVPGPQGKDKPEWKEWIEKKGFKSTEDMVRSMRNLERELTRKNMGQGANAPSPAMQANPPMAAPVYSQPVPATPVTVSEEEIAKRYNLDPDDLRRVGPLAADIASNIVAQRMGPIMAQINGINREVSRNAELQGLKEDPAFSNPQVQFEMHKILESDPSILGIEPAPYRYAFNEALRAMGRRILEEGQTTSALSEVPSGRKMSVKPPVTSGGRGPAARGTPGISEPSPVNANTFASLPLAEKRKVLVQLGRLPKE
jgi:hypothetical protein